MLGDSFCTPSHCTRHVQVVIFFVSPVIAACTIFYALPSQDNVGDHMSMPIPCTSAALPMYIDAGNNIPKLRVSWQC